MYKSFKEISLDITEEEYRNDGNYHYSTLAKYDREGFKGLETLFDRQETSSLLFGSIVDTLLTEGITEFDKKYYVNYDDNTESRYKDIVKMLHSKYKDLYASLFDIPDSEIIDMTEFLKFQLNWKPETRAKLIKEKASQFYHSLSEACGKTVVEPSVYEKACWAVEALRKSPATKFYFEEDDPFETEKKVERLYQLKFSGFLDKDGVLHSSTKKADNCLGFSCMADLIVVDHEKKEVYPCDLKTSSHKEYEFYKSFIDWRYMIQARLYWRLIRAAMDVDPVFSSYTLKDYTFIVVNKDSLNPLTWKYEDTRKLGSLFYNEQEFRDPFEIARELDNYLKSDSTVPLGISVTTSNNIVEWLNKDKCY